MRQFETLSYRGQLARLRQLGQLALTEFGFSDARMRLVNHGENTTYRIDGCPAGPKHPRQSHYDDNRFALRIHRSGYQDEKSVLSELRWIEALHQSEVVAVPLPIQTRRGTLAAEISSAGITGPRYCTVLRWLNGRFRESDPGSQHFHELGRSMALMHEHASSWVRPDDFTRRNWDWDGLFGNNSGFHLSADQVWEKVPEQYRTAFAEVAEQGRRLFQVLGNDSRHYGLIHADLHLGNVLFSRGQARIFDFDDCGFGYHLYDIVVPLSECRESEKSQHLSAAFIGGYCSVRPMPDGYLKQLETFFAIRQVSLALWATDMAQVNERFRNNLSSWITSLGDDVLRYLSGEVIFEGL